MWFMWWRVAVNCAGKLCGFLPTRRSYGAEAMYNSRGLGVHGAPRERSLLPRFYFLAEVVKAGTL